MADDRDSLARLRREIDEIDDHLHDLLMRRTLIVRQVAAAKALDAGADETAPHGVQALAMRPGREARVIRRLVARHQGELPLLVIVRLWRELMTAKTRLQAPLSVSVFAGDENAAGYWDLARFYYGSPTPLIAAQTTQDVLQKVDQDPSVIGILPAPDRAAFSWWTDLKGTYGDHVNIVARLPFVMGGEQPLDLPLAFVVAPIAPEDTGDDRTLIRIETKETMTKSKLSALLQSAGVSDSNLVAQVEGDETVLSLVDVAGFYDQGTSVFQTVTHDPSILSLDILGSFANPLNLDDNVGGSL